MSFIPRNRVGVRVSGDAFSLSCLVDLWASLMASRQATSDLVEAWRVDRMFTELCLATQTYDDSRVRSLRCREPGLNVPAVVGELLGR